jgi:ABC-type phosphate transport system auxiliary subunit
MGTIRVISLIIPALVLLAQPAIVSAQDNPSTAPANTLSESQKKALQQSLQTVEADAKTKTAPLVQKMSSIAKDLDRNLLSAKPDQDLDRKLSSDFAAAVTEVVTAAIQLKLAAVRETVKVLTPEQKKILLAELDKADTNPDLTELVGKVLGGTKQ